MKKTPTKSSLPAFADGAEETAWWRENSKLLGKVLRAAIESGKGKNLNQDELRRRIEALKKSRATMVAIRIPEADLTLARKQAKQKGLPYQTYIKSLLHQALAECETRDPERKKGKQP
jgi:predicted DNA binding CopG/RHH family protein